jgi:hypothetical protein
VLPGERKSIFEDKSNETGFSLQKTWKMVASTLIYLEQALLLLKDTSRSEQKPQRLIHFSKSILKIVRATQRRVV